MTNTAPKFSACAFCGGPSDGNYSIHRDGFGDGPEVDLCDTCGGDEKPSCCEIWDRIRVCMGHRTPPMGGPWTPNRVLVGVKYGLITLDEANGIMDCQRCNIESLDHRSVLR